MRGGTDLGFMVRIKDSCVKSGQCVFKIKINGAAKKAQFAGFGDVDMEGECGYIQSIIIILCIIM